MVPSFFVLTETLQFHKFVSADFRFENKFKIAAQKYPNRTILVSNLKVILLYMKLCILQNSRVLISNMSNVLFLNFTLKHPKKITLIPGLKDFFCTKLCNFWHSSVLISNIAIVLSRKFQPEIIQIYCSQWKISPFYRKLSIVYT